MTAEGNILKMSAKLGTSVEYFLPIGNELLNMNQFINHKIQLIFSGVINCVSCGKRIKKTYSQGYCYPCFINIPETSECIIKPELCKAHLGISRNMEWSKNFCLQKHFVYLSLTSGIKVGVTRETQIPTRWIDQGATKAIKFAKTPNRNIAGIIEVALKKHIADKTNWRKMLTNEITSNSNLFDEKEKLKEFIPKEHIKLFCQDNEITEINFPVERYPTKVKSINLDKTNSFSGILAGIKGQYLIFDNDFVINIRKYGGYNICIKTLPE